MRERLTVADPITGANNRGKTISSACHDVAGGDNAHWPRNRLVDLTRNRGIYCSFEWRDFSHYGHHYSGGDGRCQNSELARDRRYGAPFRSLLSKPSKLTRETDGSCYAVVISLAEGFIVKYGYMLGLTAAVLLASSAVEAAPSSQVNRWFCSALKEPFDREAAVAAFPLEKVPKVETSYDMPPATYAQTPTFMVAVRDSFQEPGVTTLSFGVITSGGRGPLPTPERKAQVAAQTLKWIREWGETRPSKRRSGFEGIEIEAGTEYFSILRTPGGSMIASWTAGGLALSRRLCA